jgi:formiminotetrahydrofolate cyclodeaminase
MAKLIEQPMSDVLEAFSASTATPGGGSAAARAGALGTSLLVMVSSMPRTRGGTEAERSELEDAGRRLANTRDHFGTLVDLDTQAYDAVVTAYRQPRGTDEERERRSASIETALHGAIEVPLDVMRACVTAALDAAVVARCGNPQAASDVKVGLELLGAALRGAAANVSTNVASIKEVGYAAGVSSAQRRLEEKMTATTADAMAVLDGGRPATA